MNKKNLWFLTLFSLVLVLSIYYVTMPNDLLAASTNGQTKTEKKEDINVSVEESDAISALKVENSSKTNDTLEELQDKLTNKDTTTEEKNTIYEKIKTIQANSGTEEYDDPLYNDVVDFAITTGKISASLIQRRFRVGFSRAARIFRAVVARPRSTPSVASNLFIVGTDTPASFASRR